jgi:excisionase family DNA binding protein
MWPDVSTHAGTGQGYERPVAGRHNDGQALMTPRKRLPYTVTVQKAAEVLGISEESVRKGIKNGTIPGFPYGDRPNYRVIRSELAKMVGQPEDHDFGD